jgi:thiamine pyrophosphate-dependent acetolactate synthase large subunit-like protein
MATTAADVLVDSLIDWGVNAVFGMPGDGINGLIEAFRLNSLSSSTSCWVWVCTTRA